MSSWFSNSMLLTEKTIDYLWKKQEVSANNIANCETPGFKSSYVTFEDELNLRMKKAHSLKAGAIRAQLAQASPRVHTTEGEMNKLDESNVDIVAENAELAKAGIQYEYAVRSISDDFTRLRTAIKGS